MKKCSKCKETKPLDEFPNSKQTRDGKFSYCKACRSDYNKKYKDKRHACPEKKARDRQQAADWYQINKDRVNEKQRLAYREKYGERRPKLSPEQRKENKRRYVREWTRNRRKDPAVRFKENVRSRTRNFFVQQRKVQKNNTTLELLGIQDWSELYTHLVSTAIKNYGMYLDCIDYHIDHIVPLSSGSTEGEMTELCHISNLQLLTPGDNLSKGCQIS